MEKEWEFLLEIILHNLLMSLFAQAPTEYEEQEFVVCWLVRDIVGHN